MVMLYVSKHSLDAKQKVLSTGRAMKSCRGCSQWRHLTVGSGDKNPKLGLNCRQWDRVTIKSRGLV